MTKKKAKSVVSSTFVRFLIVGLLNTAVGTVIMLVLYNAVGMGYWMSSAVAYVIGSIVSFILNRHFTFKNTEAVSKTLPRFAINIALCYILAYSIAKPAMYGALQNIFHISSQKLIENTAMLFGVGLFTVFNYVGQRYFTFRSNKI